MPNVEPDTRSDQRKQLDDRLAAEPRTPIPAVRPSGEPRPMEAFLPPRRTPLKGVVENGIIRFEEPGVTLPERSRVLVLVVDPPEDEPSRDAA